MLAGVPGGYARDKVAQQPAPTVAVRAQRPGIPVIVEGNTLFEIPEILFTFSPEERARIIAHRVIWLSKQPPNRFRALSISEEGNNSEIFSQDSMIMTATNADAETAGRSRMDLAKEYADKIIVAAESSELLKFSIQKSGR